MALSTYLEPSGMTHLAVDECADYADWCIVLSNGLGFLMLEANQITLLGIAPEARGKGYTKVLVDEAQRLRGGGELIVRAVNEEVAQKVYMPIGFQRYDGLWLTLPRTEPEPPVECWKC